MCYHPDQSHCESSPGSFDECRLSAGWPPTLSDQANRVGLRVRQKLAATIHHRHCYYYSARKLILIFTFLLVTMPNIYRLKKSLADSVINLS